MVSHHHLISLSDSWRTGLICPQPLFQTTMLRSIFHPLVLWILFVTPFVTAITSASPPDLALYGINYNIRSGPDWAPLGTKCKSDATVDADFAAIATIASRVRIYSLVDCNQGNVVLAAAKRHNLKVELGLWVNDDPRVFNAEKTRLIEMTATNTLLNQNLVTAIHVGSEAVYRKEVTTAQIIANMKEIKAIVTAKNIGIPVTIAEIGDVYLAHPELVDAVDFVSANGFPFWEKKRVEEAAAYFLSRMQPLIDQASAQKKDFVISETGWASHGSNANASTASPANAARYLKDFHALANSHKWKYYYFEAFDEPWKLAIHGADTVEACFGIFNPDRTLKREFLDLHLRPSDSHEITAAFPSPSSTPVPESGSPPSSGGNPSPKPSALAANCPM